MAKTWGVGFEMVRRTAPCSRQLSCRGVAIDRNDPINATIVVTLARFAKVLESVRFLFFSFVCVLVVHQREVMCEKRPDKNLMLLYESGECSQSSV